MRRGNKNVQRTAEMPHAGSRQLLLQGFEFVDLEFLHVAQQQK